MCGIRQGPSSAALCGVSFQNKNLGGTVHLWGEVHPPQQGLKARFRSQGIKDRGRLQIKQPWVLFFVRSLQERKQSRCSTESRESSKREGCEGYRLR
jgi:hypothetical protein